MRDEKTITAYIESVQTADNSEATKKLRIHHIRQLYEFLASRKETGICDWFFAVPKMIAPKNLNVPALWEKDNLERLLKGINCGNPAGKRDYVIILLVVQLGLRIADVSALRLERTQHKTGNRVTQPLLEDIG